MIRFREDLSAPGLWLALKDYFCRIEDPRGDNGNTKIPLPSALLSACAMFALKFPSLLQFEQSRMDPTIAHNLKSLFLVKQVPSDTHMREILDKVNPKELLWAFDVLLAKAQRGKVLEEYSYLDRGYLLSIDGTGYFESQSIHCESCCIKEKRNGSKQYYHQYLPAVIVHPKQKQVLPISAEPIQLQPGESKNDCERAATQRLLRRIRENHPKLKLIIVQDALHSNNPNIELLRELNMDFILTVKEGSHAELFQQALSWTNLGEAEVFVIEEKDKIHEFRIKNEIWLNVQFKQKVNFIEYWEHTKKGKTHWAWVTSIPLTRKNAMEVMKGGRARWKIENETFNTLKNQNYSFEHNFGHGYKHLSTNFAILMLLAFTVDQLQEHCCKVFQRAKEICGSRIYLWETMRSRFTTFLFKDWESFFHSIIYKKQILYDTS